MKENAGFTVNDLPRGERPRERLHRFGPQALSAQELLALVVGRGVSGQSVMSIAQELLVRFGSVKGVSEATLDELAGVRGIGAARAAQLKAVFELGRRQELECDYPYDRYDVRDPQSVVKAIYSSIKDKAKEHFKLILLNTRNRIIAITDVSTGTLSASLVHPREVFKDAIRHCASSIVLVHNHPSGDPEPSEEDLRITRRLIDAGKVIGIDVLDHIVIGKDGVRTGLIGKMGRGREQYCSFKERGLM